MVKTVDLPDVQSGPSKLNFKINRVGVTGVKKLVHIKRPNKENVIPLVVKMDLFVDLPAEQKGSHMSRNLELVDEIADINVKKPVSDLESFCAKVAKFLLKKHDYATFAEVKAEADYFMERKYPSGKKGLEPFKLVSEARANHSGEIKKLIGVKAIGMTACPCAMEVIRKIGDYKKDEVPPSHNQRNITTLMVEIPGESKNVDADDLIEIVEKSFSSPTYSILKRGGEGELVYDAHKKPKFVEDVVRDILSSVLKKYEDLPDDVTVMVRSESEESIHKHNAFAERATTLGELRR
ncbi:MAG: GTP cyclohydrolase MptA [Candidatus Thermoplasmatota archaeon]